MAKKLLLLCLFFLCAALPLRAQQSVKVEISGKDKGEINIINYDGQTYIEALKTAKLLKLQTSYFSHSGQLNIKGPKGYFCIIREGRSFAAVNGEDEPLSGAPVMKDGKLYAPLSFFSKGSVSQASGWQTSYEDGKIALEKFYTLELLPFKEKSDGGQNSLLSFKTSQNFDFQTSTRGRDRVDIFIPSAVIKREVSVRVKDSFIESYKTAQRFEGAAITVNLKKQAKFWDFSKSGDTFIFIASANKIVKPAAPAAPAQTVPPAGQETQTSVPPKPSVLAQNAASEEDSSLLGEDFFDEDTSSSAVKTAPRAPKKTVVNKLVTSSEYAAQKTAAAAPKTSHRARIVIDPGHGGKDSGAVRRGSSKEKDINLKVAKQVYDILKEEKNYEVRITRDNDTFIALGARARQANDFKADIFVSIHANAAKRAGANGFEVYFRSEKASDAEAAETAALENEALRYEGNGKGVSFADLLLKSLAVNEYMNESSKLAGHIRNTASKNERALGVKVHQKSAIKQANFHVLKGVEAPSVLVELGYLSNSNDRKRLNNKSIQKKMAQVIASGIKSYTKAEGW